MGAESFGESCGHKWVISVRRTEGANLGEGPFRTREAGGNVRSALWDIGKRSIAFLITWREIWNWGVV